MKRPMFLLLFLLFALAGITGAYAQYGGGDGSRGNPFLLSTAEHLKTLADEVANGNSYADKYFVLTQDVSLKNYQSGEGWTTIGTETDAFMGYFNGRGHVIKDMKINRPESIVQGFFGLIGMDARIDSLGIEKGAVIGDENVGGLAGVNFGVISNCHFTGTVTGLGKYTGGLVGNNGVDEAGVFEHSLIIKCYTAAEVTGTLECVGGITGVNTNGQIWQCWSSGNINGLHDLVGGIVGYNMSGKIHDCFNTGRITAAGNHVGGIVGMNSSPYNGFVASCYSTNVLKGKNNVGGIAGTNINGTLRDCVAAVDSITGTGANRVIGSNTGSVSSVSSNYGLSSTVVNGSTVTSINPESENGQDKTATQLTSEATYRTLKWNFNNIWYSIEGEYPLLQNVSMESADGCSAPGKLKAATPHTPDWYSVHLNWTAPRTKGGNGDNTGGIFDNGPIITHLNEGYNNAHVSAMMNGSQLVGFVGNKELNTSIADDFTLTGVAQIDSIHFYTIQTVTSDPVPATNVREVYVRIYDAAPDKGGKIIWGDFTTNRKGNVEFSRIYRAPGNDLKNKNRPVMRVTASINTTLKPGTYWLEVSVTSIIPTFTPGPGARIVFPPVTILDQPNTGNAMYCNHGVWQPCTDPALGGTCGLPFVLHGKQTSTSYNIYRNNEKINTEPVSELTYIDTAPGAGNYVYGVSAVHDTCESKQATTSVQLAQNPCLDAVVVTEFYNESFEAGFPACWAHEITGGSASWTMVLANVSEPATAPLGSYKALFKATGGASAKLISRKLDISQLGNPELSFWMAQRSLSGKQDSLRVFYKNNETGDWKLLKTIKEDIPEWENIVLALPEASATYWLAFEASGNNGYGVMLDNVSVRKAGSNCCDIPTDLKADLHTPEYYNVNLSWNAPYNAVPTDVVKVLDNGPIVTHPKAGYKGADVSAIDVNASPGGNGDQLGGYSLADDFYLDKPTYIDHLTFYTYDLTAVGTIPNIAMIFVRIYDKSPVEGGKVIWGDFYTDLLDKEATAFSNIYRTSITSLEAPARPLARVVARINHTLPAGTYWLEVTANSLIPPYQSGATWFPPVTILGKPNTGNAMVHDGGKQQWSNWVDPMSNGHCGLPFEVFGKRLPLTYDIYRDGNLIGESLVAPKFSDLAPGAGIYEYGVTAVWENGCASDTAKMIVEIAADPCETAISTFPYEEGFESPDKQFPGCWKQEQVTQRKKWEIVAGNIAKPDSTHSGLFKAYFTGIDGAATKLITPKFDLTSLEKPVVRFWHTQRVWEGDQNELRIYYKNTIDGEWVKIAEYTKNIADWTEEVIRLPKPTASYWIAFEGKGYMGHPILLDDISICEAPEYTINATAGAGGNISPAGEIIATHGDNTAFTFTPETGYRISQVLIDGKNNPEAVAGGSYTFTNIAAGHTVDVLFEKIVYTIAATSKEHGTIAPKGRVKVAYGDNQNFIFTPETGYKIAQVLINGVENKEAAASGQYEFAAVTDHHAISVRFEMIVSNDASLQGLTASAGSITPAFAPGITNYSLAVPCGVTELTVFPEALPSTDYAFFVNGFPAAMPLNIKMGDPRKELQIRTTNGTDTKVYNLTIASPFDYNKVVVTMWGQVLSVVNEPKHNGGYSFTEYQWYNGQQRLEGETRGNLDLSKYSSPGVYNVELTTVDGLKASTCNQMEVVRSTPATLVVYPNPTQGAVTINNIPAAVNVLEVYNMFGTRVAAYPVKGAQASIDISELPIGIYLIKAGQETAKLIKQ